MNIVERLFVITAMTSAIVMVAGLSWLNCL